MRRREFIGGVGAVALVKGGPATAQSTSPVVGFLSTGSPVAYGPLVQAFREGLVTLGYVENQSVAIEYRWAENRPERLRDLATELVRRGVDVIAATGGSPAVLAAKATTSTIPIIFQVGVDPVEVGLVASLSRPGGNVTGATMLATELGMKRWELLRELVPTATVWGLLVNPQSVGAALFVRSVTEAVNSIKAQLHVVPATSESDVEGAFLALSKKHVGVLLIHAAPLFNSSAKQLAALSLRHRLPAIYQFREFADAGGVLSYGGSIRDAYFQAGIYVGRVLHGEKPAELPVQQSTKVELIVNLKSAKTLGLVVPMTLLARADEIIE
jgi:putative ABC transport system substrate-binding protein